VADLASQLLQGADQGGVEDGVLGTRNDRAQGSIEVKGEQPAAWLGGAEALQRRVCRQRISRYIE
jgi:hypothetical protein